MPQKLKVIAIDIELKTEQKFEKPLRANYEGLTFFERKGRPGEIDNLGKEVPAEDEGQIKI